MQFLTFRSLARRGSFVRKGNEGDGKKEFSEDDLKVFEEGFCKFPPPDGCKNLLGTGA